MSTSLIRLVVLLVPFFTACSATKSSQLNGTVLSTYNAVLGDGGWSSGGGEFIREARNPWFLSNVKTLNYCVLIDEVNFGTSRAQAEKQIKKAFDFWRHEFNFATPANLIHFGEIKIAQQEFVQTECSENTDLVFQLGVLTAEQADYLKKPKELAAVSVRTHYSIPELRGRGFIYVSPSSGPLAFTAGTPGREAWAKADSALLKLTLMHELGHVFGLPHMGSFGHLMSEAFPEMLLTLGGDPVDMDRSAETFFSFPKGFKGHCAGLEQITKFFSLDPSWKCFKTAYSHSGGGEIMGITKVTFYAGPSMTSLVELGSADLSIMRFFPGFIQPIWLPEGQEVFKDDEILFKWARNGITGAIMLSIAKRGKFHSVDGKLKREIMLRFDQGSPVVSIEGVNAEGEIVTIL